MKPAFIIINKDTGLINNDLFETYYDSVSESVQALVDIKNQINLSNFTRISVSKNLAYLFNWISATEFSEFDKRSEMAIKLLALPLSEQEKLADIIQAKDLFYGVYFYRQYFHYIAYKVFNIEFCDPKDLLLGCFDMLYSEVIDKAYTYKEFLLYTAQTLSGIFNSYTNHEELLHDALNDSYINIKEDTN